MSHELKAEIVTSGSSLETHTAICPKCGTKSSASFPFTLNCYCGGHAQSTTAK